MQLNQYNGGNPGGLRLEQKTNWQAKKLTAPMLFIHGGPMSPSDVRANGLDAVRFGMEWVVDQASKQPIGGGKLIFSFLVVAGNQPPANYDKSAAVRKLWGTEGHCYIFEAPTGTTFYSTGEGQPVAGMEIAFPYLIQSADMRFYCTPDTRGMHGGAQRKFQMVSWNAVVSAQTQNLGI